ncbi:MAG: (S)-phenoxypropionate/alpha-ketoglutarate-dioxygenase [Gammaproteobacteria bacterium]|nr:MAG: (S)-phenoxypropionate/alpha-ketoglutarate-dioxygenase [Gammaproteobacteria bacterium]
MSNLSFKAISPVFGAVVEGFDVDNVLVSDGALLNEALDRFGVLVFPGLELAESQQLEMAKVFGEPSKRSRPSADRAERSPYADFMGLVTNVRKDGVPIGSLPDGEMWLHHDGCFIDEPYRATILYALEVTSVGGETRFVDMRAVFRSLSEDLVSRIKYLQGTHSFDYRNIAARPSRGSSSDITKSATHPSVIMHPNSNEPALYLNPLCTVRLDGEGSNPSDNENLLDLLFEAIDQSMATFSHRWTKGDLVIWDNWSTCHARNDFPAGETRMLRRNIIKGQTLDAYFK